jgi:hypothetical protein
MSVAASSRISSIADSIGYVGDMVEMTGGDAYMVEMTGTSVEVRGGGTGIQFESQVGVGIGERAAC